ncbi:hypothetical protein E6C76_08240 [Pseudothauera nasutitermitis]|uniref:Uncharacterized protein n=1 Tax=Pseudothauera nasutitermitis TaxID=2565930 RepID=A0A4S4AZF8_9RHOO|nr:calcium-binding protein [Pseudothauera nasutitermitis]THF65559.1 hypothetical protein E6C76_08240 [Pseudothauera nasutitermitis]
MSYLDELHKISSEYADNFGLSGPVNGDADAFRHAYSSAQMTRDYGYESAYHAGTWWEILGLINGEKESAARMDAWNNYVGREIARELGPNATNDQLADAVRKALEDGRLVREPQNGSGGQLFDKIGNGISDALDRFIERIKDLFNKAESQASPIILDLDGDGVTTVSKTSGIHFDHDSNGFAELSGWVGAGDGLLVWDRNGNGVIDDGAELFGNNTLLSTGQKAANGFAALRDLDGNGDGVFDAYDVLWSELRVWRDQNQDGVSQADELLTLDELGIASIYLGYTNSTYIDAQGNAHKQVGSFTWADGSTGTATDVWFSVDYADTVELDLIEVPEDIAALPNLAGFGNVRSLHQAMARDESGQLRALVEQFGAETDPRVRHQLMEEILYAWTGAGNIAANSRGANIDARKLVALETFLGDGYNQTGSWGKNPGPQAALVLEEAFQTLHAELYQGLMRGTHLQALIEQIGLVWSDDGLQFSLATVAEHLNELYATDRLQAVGLAQSFSHLLSAVEGIEGLEIDSFVHHLGGSGSLLAAVVLAGNAKVVYGEPGANVSGTSADEILIGSSEGVTLSGGSGRDIVLGGSGNDTLYGDAGNDTLNGGAGDDVIYAGAGNDVLYGGEGNDSLYGEAGNDTLDGGAGNDYLVGGNGSDTYLFRVGSGQDRVYNYDASTNRIDVVRFEDVASDGLSGVFRAGDDLILAYGESDRVTLRSHYLGNSYQVNRFEFSDGKSLTVNQLYAAYDIQLSEGNDSITFTASNERIDGGAGDDVIYAGAGNDVLYGGEGNDSLYGEAGNDTLDGGAGNDYLVGGNGSDTYLFRVGSGQDRVYNYDASTNRIDVVRFEDVASDGLSGVFRAGDDLILAYGESDRVTLRSHYLGSNYQVNRFEFSDGKSLTVNQLYAAYDIQLSEGNDSITFTASNERIDGGAGDDVIYAGAGNDVLYGGEGNDSLYGEAGNDTLDGGAGNDYLVGGNGSDTYLFRVGSGQDRVYNYNASTNRIDVVRFEDVASDGLSGVFRAGDDLILAYGESDRVTLRSHYLGSNYQVNRFEFSDGKSLTVNQLYAAYDIQLSEGNDSITFTASNERIDGGAGDDVIYAGAGNDVLYGGEGNDSLYGEAGNDTLDGGAGNDYLVGGTGSDTYLFGRGYGQDTVYDYDTTSGNADRLFFGDDIASDQLWFSRNGNHLQVSVIGTDDQVTINNWYSGSAYRVEQFHAGGGAVLLHGQVAALVSAMAAFSPPAAGETCLSGNYRETLDAVIAANWQ